MAIAINSTLQNARSRIVNGPAGQFFQWWGDELRNVLPAPLRARMQYARRRLLTEVRDDEICLSVDDGGSVQLLDTIDPGQDVHLQQQQLRELLQHHELNEVSRDLLLPESAVLITAVTMPLATEKNLRQALGYEMDRHTPFQAEEVFYNWRNLHRDREASQLQFELFVTPRKPVLVAIEKLKSLGLAPSAVDVAGVDGPCGINLLPHALRYKVVNQRTRINRIVAAVAIALFVFVMAQSLWLREHQLTAVQEAIDEVRSEALAVQQIRQQIEDATEAAGFLQLRRSQNGSKVILLAELTGLLPDDTYLDRLTMQAGTVQMQGRSDNSQSLIELINESPMFEDASFRGPTRLDNRSGKEIFDLSANVTTGDAG